MSANINGNLPGGESTYGYHGMKLMSYRIDEQFIELLSSMLLKAVDKVQLGLSEAMGLEVHTLIELLYYSFSIGFNTNATPGMHTLGIEMFSMHQKKPAPIGSEYSHSYIQHSSSFSSNYRPGGVHASRLILAIALKWALLRLQRLSITNGTIIMIMSCELCYS